MTTTPARTLANRANAARSTGPRTPAGKARALSNATQHGLTARLDVTLAGEDPVARQAFGDGMLAELAPVGELERFYAQRAVWLAWRLSRVPGIEAAVMAQGRATIQCADAIEDMREARDRAFRKVEGLVEQAFAPDRESPDPLAFARTLRDRLETDGPKEATAAREGKLTAAQRKKLREKRKAGKWVAMYTDRGAQAGAEAARRHGAVEKHLRADPVLSGRAFATAADRGLWDCLGRYERGIARELERTIATLRAEQERRSPAPKGGPLRNEPNARA